MIADLTQEKFRLDERVRMGLSLIVLYDEDIPLGSFTLDPETQSYIIETIRELPAKWNQLRREAEKRSSNGRNEKKSRGDGI